MAVSSSSVTGSPRKENLSLFSLFPFYLLCSGGLDAMFFECWALSQLFLFCSFTLIKRLFSSSSLSAIRVLSSANLSLLIFFPAILRPACDSSSPAFHMMYSAYKLNKQGDSIQLCHIPFPILNQSAVPCPVLTAASWPTSRFLRRQVRWFDIPIFLGIFQFVVIHTKMEEKLQFKLR